MNIRGKTLIVILLAVLTFGLWLGKTYFPITKVEQIEREVIHKDIQVVTREIVRPDGSKEITTTSTDKSQEKRDTKLTAVATSRPDWHVSASVSRESLIGPNIYAVTVERRVLGPFSIGLTANTQQTIGLVVGMEF